jgi:hypothetical protein
MKENLRIILLTGILLGAFQGLSQVEDFEYKVPIFEAQSGWNALKLPLDIFSKTNKNLSDIRIYRTDLLSQKSFEQPYIIEIQEDKIAKTEAAFKIINPTQSKGLYSFTFELSNQESVNNIYLDFANRNFDWSIHLEGSMDQNTWSTIVNGYRIVALKNKNTNFSSTNLAIPESKFNFYKITFSADFKPILKSALIFKEELSQGSYFSYEIQDLKKEDDVASKTTIIELDLGKPLPVSQITLTCNTKNDYYRPFKIEGVTDSFETEKGRAYRYQKVYQGTINSIHDNVFDFYNGIFQKFRITINNFDNQPLTFTEYLINGPEYRLITRLDNAENLWLYYGNKEATKPIYDISYFKDKIPDEPNLASLGGVEHIPKKNNVLEPLFKNKWWLWGILIIVIILLGTFTLKMLKEEQ